MKKYTFEEVAPFVISRQNVEKEEFSPRIYWYMPDGREVTDFSYCVHAWMQFLNDTVMEEERGY